MSMKNLRDSRSDLTYGSVGVSTKGVTAVEELGTDVSMVVFDLVVMMDSAPRSSDDEDDSGDVSLEGGLPFSRLLGIVG